MVPNQALAQIDAPIVEEMVELDPIKAFLQLNKLVHNVLGSGEEITNPCGDCNGQGNKQNKQKSEVTIPKGVDDGTRIRLAGKGEAGTRGGTSGDLYLFINVRVA